MAFYVQATFVVMSLVAGLLVGDGRFAGSSDTSLEFLLRPWDWPRRDDLWLFVWCGIGSAVGNYLLGQAYRLGAPSLVAPFEYVALPLAVLWGILLFDDWPDSTACVGMALILGSGLYVLYREKVRKQSVVSERPMPRNR
jgi:drug/metabolite transporter (DMT)-like permease